MSSLGVEPEGRPSGDAERAQLLAIAAGDRQAFAVWMRGAEPRLRASLRRFAAVADVEAVLQESLLRIWQMAPRLEAHAEGSTLTRVALRVARNLALDQARRLRAAPLDPEFFEPLDPGDERPDPLLRALLLECEAKLPKKPGLALGARLSSAGARHDTELASEVGMQPATFLKNLQRARKLLSDCLAARGVLIGEHA